LHVLISISSLSKSCRSPTQSRSVNLGSRSRYTRQDVDVSIHHSNRDPEVWSGEDDLLLTRQFLIMRQNHHTLLSLKRRRCRFMREKVSSWRTKGRLKALAMLCRIWRGYKEYKKKMYQHTFPPKTSSPMIRHAAVLIVRLLFVSAMIAGLLVSLVVAAAAERCK
ncbi:hypothetical protein KCU92_g211, partial [Aureobasidium melanogenum]